MAIGEAATEVSPEPTEALEAEVVVTEVRVKVRAKQETVDKDTPPGHPMGAVIAIIPMGTRLGTAWPP